MTGDMSTRIYITGIYQQTDISELETFWQTDSTSNGRLSGQYQEQRWDTHCPSFTCADMFVFTTGHTHSD